MKKLLCLKKDKSNIQYTIIGYENNSTRGKDCREIVVQCTTMIFNEYLKA